jgi:uncharacterized membrane protein YedE/YeeE
MKKVCLVAWLSGTLFGFGLALSQMIDPLRVRGFLDVTGPWDPTLLFVLMGAVTVTLITFRFVLRKNKPVCEPAFCLPQKKTLDRGLIFGSILFGLGWGITGYCPGPALASLARPSPEILIFVAAMLAGSLLARLLATKRTEEV